MSVLLKDDDNSQASSSENHEMQGAQPAESGHLRVRGKRKVEDERPSTGTIRTQLPSDDSICAQCSNLDLLGAVRKATHIRQHETVLFDTELYFGIRVANVGHRFRIPQTTDCALCSILFDSRICSDADRSADEEGDEIRLIGFLDCSRLVRFPFQFREHDSTHLAVVPVRFGSNRLDDFEVLRKHVYDQGAAVLLRDEDHPVAFSVQEVPDHFDPRVVNSWMHYCKSNHSSRCGGSTNSAITGLRLINCWSLSIIDADDKTPYVALSYVWSKPGDAYCRVRRTRNRLILPARLSPVISDSISVTKALGFQYLWVDKFCIDQDDPDAKHQQIEQMRAIYANADLTIAAVAGTDETCGLPGVGRTPRSPQKIARLNLNGIRVISTMKHPHASIQASRWASRGWTFQEAVLSRRRLVFTDQQLYFECCSMDCFESLHSPLDLLHVKDKSVFLDTISAGTFETTRSNFIWRHSFGRSTPDKMSLDEIFRQYMTAIEDYSSRELSYDSDSLNAFQGIIQRYSKLQQPFNAIWGIPYPAQGYERSSYFSMSLAWMHTPSCWEHSRRVRRRQEFPSWTWAGWAGTVQIPRDHPISHLDRNGLQSVLFGDKGTEKDLGSLDCKIPELDCRVLRLLAKPLPLGLLSFEVGRSGKINWTFKDYQAGFFPSQERMTGPQFRQELMDARQWRCIWLHAGASASLIMVLELNNDTGTWTRAGMFHVPLCSGIEMKSLMDGVEATWFHIV